MRNMLVTLALATAVPACAYDGGGVDPGATPIRQTLDGRAFLDLGADSHVGVIATGPDGKAMPDVAPVVTGGRAVLRSTADGVLIIEDLDVTLADVTVPAGTFGDQPIRLTDLALRLGTQVDVPAADWAASGLSVGGDGSGDLLLDWSWVLDDGSIYPLATQKLKDAPFQVAVRQDTDGQLRAAFWMSHDGELRKFADRVTLSNLSLAVVANGR